MPRPAYYADRLCDRARCWLRGLLVRTSTLNGDILPVCNIPQHIKDVRQRDLWVIQWVTQQLQSKNQWGHRAGLDFPWHENLNDRMFYL